MRAYCCSLKGGGVTLHLQRPIFKKPVTTSDHWESAGHSGHSEQNGSKSMDFWPKLQKKTVNAFGADGHFWTVLYLPRGSPKPVGHSKRTSQSHLGGVRIRQRLPISPDFIVVLQHRLAGVALAGVSFPSGVSSPQWAVTQSTQLPEPAETTQCVAGLPCAAVDRGRHGGANNGRHVASEPLGGDPVRLHQGSCLVGGDQPL